MNKKTFTVGVLSLMACAMTRYFHSIGTDRIFWHFYYLPIILAAIWWERRSWFLTASLCAFLLVSRMIAGLETALATDLTRAAAFLLVGGVLAELSRAHRLAGEALRASFHHQAGILESMLDVVIVANPDGAIRTANRAALELLGYAKEEIIGQPVDTIFEKEEFFRGTGVARLVRKGAVRDVELLLRTKSGESVPVVFNGAVIRDNAGRLSAILGVARDMRERQRAEIERERLLAALERRTSQLQTAAEVSSTANGILEPDALIQQVVDLARKQFALYYAGLFLVDESGTWAVLQAGSGVAGRRMVEQGHKLKIGGNSMIGWCVAYQQARIALDVGIEAVRFANPLLPETRSEMALPLSSRGKALGALTIQSTEEAAFSDEDITVLQTMADQLANAIANASLYEQAQREIMERQRAEEALRRYADEQATLYAVASASSSSLEPDDLLSATLDAVLPVLDSKIGWVTLPGPTLDAPPRIVAWRNVPTEFLAAETSLPLRDCPVCAPLLTGGEAQTKPVLLVECPRLPAEILDKAGLHSHSGISLRTGEQTLGVLNVAWRGPRGYTEADRALLTAIGQQVGLALHNAQLYQAARQVDRLRMLNELDQALAATLDPDMVVEITLQRIAAAVNAPMGTLFAPPSSCSGSAVNYPERMFILGRGWAKIAPSEENQRRWQAFRPCWRESHEIVPFSGDELAALVGRKRPGLAASWGPHGLLIPIWSNKTLLAVLSLGGRPATQPFTEGDQSLALAAATRASQATQNARLYQTAKKAESRYRNLYHGVPVGLYRITSEGQILSANHALTRMLGYSDLESLLAVNATDLYVDARDRRQWQALAAGEENSFEVRLRRHDGSVIYLLDTVRASRDASGQLMYYEGSLIDITARVQLEQQLAAIHQLGRELTLLHDEDVILRRVLESAASVLQFDSLGCGLVDEEAGELVCQYRIADDMRGPIELRLPLDGEWDIVAAVYQSGQTINVPDIAQDPRYVSISKRRSGGSELCVPLKIGTQIIGVLNAKSSQLHHFTPTAEQLLQTLADQSAVALENARLYRASQKQVARLAALNTVSTAVVSSLELDTVLHQALESVSQVLDAPEGSILLRDPETDELVFEHVLGVSEMVLRGYRLAPGQGVAGWVVQQGQAVRVNDMDHETRFYAGVDAATGFETRSLLCVPLRYRGETVGVTEIINKRQGKFTVEDLSLLEAASSIIAQALENARLYQNLLNQMQAREKAQVQLIRSEKMGALGRLTASIAHEINNPLQAMQSCLTLATERLVDIPHDEKLDRYLSIIEDETARVSNIVRRVSGFYRPAREVLQPTDLHAVLESTLQLIGKQLQHADIIIEREWVAELPLILANPDHLKQVYLNLVLNALDAMPEGGTLRIRTALEPPDFLRVEFGDTGEGMSPETQARLFEPFFTTKEQGSGLGLPISYRIIRSHGGEITVTSEEGVGTTFTIRLPVERRVKRET